MRGVIRMEEKFSKEGLTFDDVLLVPAHSQVTPDMMYYLYRKHLILHLTKLT